MSDMTPFDELMAFARERGTQSVDTLNVRRLSQGATLPTYGSDGAAGLDLSADLTTYEWDDLEDSETPKGIDRGLVIRPGERKLVKTGLSIGTPRGTYGRIAPRSGLAYKKGIDTMAGVIDEDYRGEVGVILMNLDFEVNEHDEVISMGDNLVILHGDRIAQLIIEKYVPCLVRETDDLSTTVRGGAGFGSTGV